MPANLQFLETSTLKIHPDNPRTHDEASIREIARSIKKLGFRAPIYVWKDRIIVAGAGRYLAAKRLRIGVLPCIVDEEMDEATAMEYMVADNKTHEFSGQDDVKLAGLVKTFDLKDIPGFTDEQLAAITQMPVLKTAPEPETNDVNDIPDVPSAEPITKPGDHWHLGNHVLICGDSLAYENWKQLVEGYGVAMVLTDPPYAIYGSSSGVSSDVADDKMVRPFFENMFRRIWDACPWFAHVYVHCDWRSWAAVSESAKRVGLDPKNMLVWDKQHGGLGSMYSNSYELIGFWTKTPKSKTMTANNPKGQRMVYKPNLIRCSPVESKKKEHNATKPVELLAEFLRNSSDEGEGVLDLFGGSGSTLIACEQEKRQCVMFEVEPKFCDIICARWERLTGRKRALSR